MEEFDPGEAVRLAEAEGVTVWFAIPTSWQMILDVARVRRARHCRKLRFVGSGGAACPEPIMDRFAELGLPYRQGYGLSESTSSATTMQPEDQAAQAGLDRPAVLPRRGPDCRRSGPGRRARRSGRDQLRGRNVCAGYWRKPEETAAAFDADGWFHTGDIGVDDEDGFICIVDRKKDLIISGGENIYLGRGRAGGRLATRPCARPP